jgi:hypothetical protein
MNQDKEQDFELKSPVRSSHPKMTIPRLDFSSIEQQRRKQNAKDAKKKKKDNPNAMIYDSPEKDENINVNIKKATAV